MEHDEQADAMEREADRMEQESDRVGDHIDDARRDWDAKEQDPSVPGARPDEEEEDAGDKGPSGARVDEGGEGEEDGARDG
jgi:hypothetical protein